MTARPAVLVTCQAMPGTGCHTAHVTMKSTLAIQT